MPTTEIKRMKQKSVAEDMIIQQQQPKQFLSLLYETIKATTTITATALTITIQTTKATFIGNYSEKENNLTATQPATLTATATTTITTNKTILTLKLLHMSKNTHTTTTANLLPKTAFTSIYATTPLLTSFSPAASLHWQNVTTTNSLVANLVESLSSLEYNGNFTYNDSVSTTTTTTLTIHTATQAYLSNSGNDGDNTLPPFIDSYVVGMTWSKALVVAIFMLLILVTVVGNTLVILSVLTTRRLRTVTNCFVLNLAITDWLVGTCVMPPAVIHYICEGVWRFGWILCDIWISLDVLLCTASILSLCAISLDRYLAVTQPLNYSKNRRTKRLALIMIFIVWVTALSITCPPYLGWYEPGRRENGNTDCRYNQNKGYVVFSAMGSFFIPMAVMVYVYLKIGYVLTSRRQRIVRDANSERTADHDIDCDNFISESEHFQCGPQKFPFKTRWNIDASAGNSKSSSLKCSKCNKNYIEKNTTLKHQASFYELVEVSRLTVQSPVLPAVTICTSINCRYANGACTPTAGTTNVTFGVADALSPRGTTLQQINCMQGRTSCSETCLAAVISQVNKYTTSTNAQQQEHNLHYVQPTEQQTHNQQQPPHQHQHQHQHHHQHHQHHHQRVPMRVSTTKRDTKTTKTLTMVMGGFIACWLPFFIYYLLMPFLPPPAVSEGLMSFLTWVGWVNCAINPFIYAFYNPDFRTAFWRLTCKRICKQKLPSNHMAMFRG